MANFIKVDFEIKDVENARSGIGKKKRKNGTETSKPTTPTAPMFANLGFEPSPEQKASAPSSSDRVKIVERVAAAPVMSEARPSTAAPSSKPPPPIRPKSASQLHRPERSNGYNRIPHIPEPWKFTAKGLDFDSLLVEQDMYISNLRLRNPDPYQDDSREKPEPSLTRPSSANHSVRNFSKTRVLPNSIGCARNNPFPQYPFLHPDSNNIHPHRWSVMSVLDDGPERLKPVLSAPGKSREDLFKSFYGHGNDRHTHINKFKDLPDDAQHI